MKKKFLKLGVMLLALSMLFSIKVSAYTINSAEISITPSKTEYNSGNTVDFVVSLKSLNADTGLIAMGAYVTYDSNVLTLNTATEGISGWDNATISSKTNRFVTTKMEHSKNSEDILKISFTAKDVSKSTKTSISLKSVELSNGAEYDIKEVKSSEVTINPKSSAPQNPSDDDNPGDDDDDDKDNPENPGNKDDDKDNSNTDDNNKDNNQNNNNSNTNNNNSNNNNSNTNNKNNNNNQNSSNDSNKKKPSAKDIIPYLGSNPYLVVIILGVTIITVLLFVRMRLLDRKIKKQSDNDFKDKDKDEDKNKDED